MELLTFRIEPGQEIMDVLTREFQAKNLTSGAIVSVIGATENCCISNMPESDPKKDILTEYKKPLELSGIGEIREGKPHIHCTLSGKGDVVIHGHLHWAKVKAW
ncbi:MAG: PPC domain-containing DNA-binding protein, partial [Candidatus Gracilibacteria bacterium]